MSIVIQLHVLSYVISTDRVVFLAANKEEIQDIIRTLIFSLLLSRDMRYQFIQHQGRC